MSDTYLRLVARTDDMDKLAEAELEASIAAKFPPPRYPHTTPAQDWIRGPVWNAAPQPVADQTLCTDAGMDDAEKQITSDPAVTRRFWRGYVLALLTLALTAALILARCS